MEEYMRRELHERKEVERKGKIESAAANNG